MKRFVILALLTLLCGCSAVQIRELFFGMSIQDVESSETKYTKTFDLDGSFCFDKALETAMEMQAQVLCRDAKKYFITANGFDKAYVLCVDTTQLGILITPLEGNKSQIDVASGDYGLAKFVSKKLFEKLGEQEKLRKEGKQ